MHVARLLPSIADLVARAISETPFVREISGEPHSLSACAELAAELAAEAWERSTGAPAGVTVPHSLTAQAARALVKQAPVLVAGYAARRAAALSRDAAKLERAISLLDQVRTTIAGTLAHPEAEELLDLSEDHLDALRVKCRRALTVTEAELDRVEAV